MKNIKFKECNIEIAKEQQEYNPIWAFTDGLTVVTCYKLNIWERIRLLFSGKLWLALLTYGNPLQPHLPSVNKNDFIFKEDEL